MSFSNFFRWLLKFLKGDHVVSNTSSNEAETDSIRRSGTTEPTSGVSMPTSRIEEVAPTNEGETTTDRSTPSEGVDNSIDELTSPPRTIITPKLVSFTTESTRLVLSKETEFQVETKPKGYYDGITITVDSDDVKIIKPFDKATGIISLRVDKRSYKQDDSYSVTAFDGTISLVHKITGSLQRTLWHNHVGRHNICDANRFRNQCAIRMGACLELSGIKLPLDRRKLRRCTTEYRVYSDHQQGKVQGHVLAAQELANWIHSTPDIFGERKIYQSKEALLGKRGIIFFRDGWDTTDHIDVWDGKHLVGGFDSYFYSDFKDLWFWEIY